jgi:glyceraldehyde 3-phosphate dehydrogenase
MQETYSNELEVYVNQERAAVELINSIGKLLFDKSIELVLFRNHLADTNISEVLRLHNYAAEVVGKPISVFDTAELAKDLYGMDLAPAKIDIGKLASEWLAERDRFNAKKDFRCKTIGTKRRCSLRLRSYRSSGGSRIGAPSWKRSTTSPASHCYTFG